MRRLTGTEIIALWKRIDADQGQWRNTWEDLARYNHPAKIGFVGEREEGQKKTEYLFDSTAIQALDDLGHYLATALTPNAQQWAKLQFKDMKTSEMVDVREWLEETGNRMQAAWLSSNFYKMAGECYKDIACFGSMCMEAHERKGPNGEYAGLNFDNVYLRDAGGITNQYGEIDTTIRRYEKNAIGWYNEFGSAAGQAVMAAMEAGRPDEKFKFLNICYPRDAADVDPESRYLGDALATELPWASVWVEEGKAEIVKESGFYQPSRVIARWDINTDNTYGHGPGLKALPDVRSLNEAKRLELDWVEKNIDPPLKTRENNVVGDLDISAGGLTAVRDLDALQEVYSNTRNYEIVMFKTEELKDSIRGIFYSDLIRDEGLARRTGVSDFEVARRMERAQRILGEAVGGLRNEFLRWVVEKTFSIMYRADQLEEPPQVDAELDVSYVSPLQTAQQAQGAESTALFIAEMAQVAQVQVKLGRDPDILDRVDFDAMSKKMADARNVPADILRSDEEVMQLRMARNAARKRANDLKEAEQAAGITDKLGQTVGAENALELIQGG